MSKSAAYIIEKFSDKIIINFLDEATSLIGAKSYRLTLAGSGRDIVVDAANNSGDEIEAIRKNDGFVIYTATIDVEKFTIAFSRQASDRTIVGFDSLMLSNNQMNHPVVANPFGNGLIIELDALISRSFFEPLAGSSSALYKNPNVFKEVMRSHQRMLERLQEAILTVGEQAVEARAELEREYWNKNSNLKKEFENRQSASERAISEAKKRLEEQEVALNERRKKLDDRDNTHARRDLHSKLKARIAEHSKKFELTPESRERRKPIHIAITISILILCLLLVVSSIGLIDVYNKSPSMGVLLAATIKPVGLTVVLLGLLSWYLRWMNRWFERHAEAEFQLKQFELDIDRASWVVETALEWKFKQENQIPDHLLESISRNLFTRGETDETADMHPADYLASALLGRASGLKLKVPGAEIDYGRKDINKLGLD